MLQTFQKLSEAEILWKKTLMVAERSRSEHHGDAEIHHQITGSPDYQITPSFCVRNLHHHILHLVHQFRKMLIAFSIVISSQGKINIDVFYNLRRR